MIVSFLVGTSLIPKEQSHIKKKKINQERTYSLNFSLHFNGFSAVGKQGLANVENARNCVIYGTVFTFSLKRIAYPPLNV